MQITPNEIEKRCLSCVLSDKEGRNVICRHQDHPGIVGGIGSEGALTCRNYLKKEEDGKTTKTVKITHEWKTRCERATACPGTGYVVVDSVLTTEAEAALAEARAQRDALDMALGQEHREKLDLQAKLAAEYDRGWKDGSKSPQRWNEEDVEIAQLKAKLAVADTALKEFAPDLNSKECALGVLASRMIKMGYSYDSKAGIWWNENSKPGVIEELEAKLAAAGKELEREYRFSKDFQAQIQELNRRIAELEVLNETGWKEVARLKDELAAAQKALRTYCHEDNCTIEKRCSALEAATMDATKETEVLRKHNMELESQLTAATIEPTKKWECSSKDCPTLRHYKEHLAAAEDERKGLRDTRNYFQRESAERYLRIASLEAAVIDVAENLEYCDKNHEALIYTLKSAIKPSGDGKGVVRVPLTSAESGPTSRGAPAPETPEGKNIDVNAGIADEIGKHLHQHTETPEGFNNVIGMPDSAKILNMIAWCEEHGRETVNKVIFGSFDSYSSGFTLFFECGRKNWFKFPFLLDPVFTIPSGGEHAGAGYGAQGEPTPPNHQTSFLGLETPASKSSEGEFTCDHCAKHMDTIAVQLDFGFGSTRDDERFIFCSDECFTKWVHEQFDSPTMTGASYPDCDPVECGIKGYREDCPYVLYHCGKSSAAASGAKEKGESVEPCGCSEQSKPSTPVDTAGDTKIRCPNCQTECHPMCTPDWDKINKVWVTEYRCKYCRQIFGMHTKPPLPF